MDLPLATEQRAKVEQFRRKHRTALLALVFTDLVGSTRLKQDLGDFKAITLIQKHHALVRELLGGFPEAEEIGTAGDSFFIVFVRPSDAVRFALLLQARLRSLNSDAARLVLDRIGIHVGEVLVEEREDSSKLKDLYGIQVDTCARVMSLAQGNQILLSRAAFDNARPVLKGEDIEGVNSLSWMNHGPYELEGVEEPLEICEVGEKDKTPLKPPTNTGKARRSISVTQELVLGWRPALSETVPNTKWILERKLGEGGFGEVWLGRHETLKEERVFKFCFQADRVRSLKREVTIFRLLKERLGNHPNIVGIQEVFFDRPPFYIVMDYVPCDDLSAWCAHQGGIAKVPLETRIEIIAQIADALQAAHDAGVIHRDIKPSNILVTGGKSVSGVQARLTDFGIGQVIAEEALAKITQRGFTQTMSPLQQAGTYMYMSPELFAGKPASVRSDIHSLGIVLYQLLVGDFAEPLTMFWDQNVSDSFLKEDLRNCFAVNGQDSFEEIKELAASLRGLAQRRTEFDSTQRRRARDRRISWITRATLAAVCLIAGVIGGIKWKRARDARDYVNRMTIPARMIADLSTAALAFQNEADAGEILTACRIDPNIIAAALYDREGKRFAVYGPQDFIFPRTPGNEVRRIEESHLIIFEKVVLNDKKLGTIYVCAKAPH